MSELSFGQIMRRNCEIDAQAGVMEFQGQWYDGPFWPRLLTVWQISFGNSRFLLALKLPLCAAIALIRLPHFVP